MLSKEELERLKQSVSHSVECGEIQRGYTYDLLENIDAMQAQINKLEENATAQALALKAAKAMQQAETERADANERDAERYRWLRSANPFKIEDPELRESIGSLPANPGDVDDAIDQAMSNM